MATEKNITMKQFNGTDYDTLYPKTIASQIPDVYSKTDIITTETLSQLGLSSDKLPNDAFQQIKTLIDNAQASADGKAKIQTGSYVGTGTYGANNPCSLTFDFEPWLLIVENRDGVSYYIESTSDYVHYPILNVRCNRMYAAGTSYNIFTWAENSVSWYCPSTGSTASQLQLNQKDTIYNYISIEIKHQII